MGLHKLHEMTWCNDGGRDVVDDKIRSDQFCLFLFVAQPI
jgi:hypothetical protein